MATTSYLLSLDSRLVTASSLLRLNISKSEVHIYISQHIYILHFDLELVIAKPPLLALLRTESGC